MAVEVHGRDTSKDPDPLNASSCDYYWANFTSLVSVYVVLVLPVLFRFLAWTFMGFVSMLLGSCTIITFVFRGVV